MSTIRTVDRAFAILQIMAKHPNGIGVNAIAEQMDLAKSTVSRLLATMQNREIVERMANQRYRIGAEPIRWFRYQPLRTMLPALADPVLREIAEETGEATAICIRAGNEVIYLNNVQSQQELQVRDWTNEQLPLHVVSPGKILLAFAGDDFIDSYLQQELSAFTPQTIVDQLQLRTHLTKIREEGYASTDEEFAEGISGVSMPVKDTCSKVVGALCVYGPKFRLGTPTTLQKCIHCLRNGAKKMVIPA